MQLPSNMPTALGGHVFVTSGGVALARPVSFFSVELIRFDRGGLNEPRAFSFHEALALAEPVARPREEIVRP